MRSSANLKVNTFQNTITITYPNSQNNIVVSVLLLNVKALNFVGAAYPCQAEYLHIGTCIYIITTQSVYYLYTLWFWFQLLPLPDTRSGCSVLSFLIMSLVSIASTVPEKTVFCCILFTPLTFIVRIDLDRLLGLAVMLISSSTFTENKIMFHP